MRGNATEDATEPAMNMHTDNPILLTLMISKKVHLKDDTSRMETTGVKAHTHVHTFSHTHKPYCVLYTPNPCESNDSVILAWLLIY